jgi:hypothetical protein
MLAYGAIPELLECPLCGPRRVAPLAEEADPQVAVYRGPKGSGRGLVGAWSTNRAFGIVEMSDWWLARCGCCYTVLAAEAAPLDVPLPIGRFECARHQNRTSAND